MPSCRRQDLFPLTADREAHGDAFVPISNGVAPHEANAILDEHPSCPVPSGFWSNVFSA